MIKLFYAKRLGALQHLPYLGEARTGLKNQFKSSQFSGKRVTCVLISGFHGGVSGNLSSLGKKIKG